MGRGKSKGKKSTTITKNKNPNISNSNEEKSVQPVRRRGRPQKPSKEEPNFDKAQRMEEKTEIFDARPKEEIEEKEKQGTDGWKRKLNVDDNSDLTEDENGSGFVANGFRPIGSRRKNKHPRRAAGVGIEIECN